VCIARRERLRGGRRRRKQVPRFILGKGVVEKQGWSRMQREECDEWGEGGVRHTGIFTKSIGDIVHWRG